MILPKNITANKFRHALEKSGGDTFPPKTLKSMIQDAGWREEDLEGLGLVTKKK